MTIKRKKVERVVYCDTERLYGPLSDAIKYLSEINSKFPKATLEENWKGYEDIEMRFSWMDDETDEEFEHRKKLIEIERQMTADREAKEKEVRELAYKRELEAVNRKYGK